MSAGGFLLGALVVFAATMGSRLPWTRLGGLIWGGLAVGFGLWIVPEASGGASPASLPAALFCLLAACAFWWSMHREQEPLRPKTSTMTEAPPEPDEDPAGLLGRPVGVCAGILGVLILAWLRPPSLDAPAATPWFLAGLDEIAAWTTPWIGWVFLPTAILVALLAAPFLDTRDPDLAVRFRGRSDEVPFFFFAWFFLGLLPIAMATCLRPSGGLGPIRSPDAPLSQRFWVDWIGVQLPDPWIVRELPGMVALTLLFVVLPWRLPSWKPTQGAFSRHRRRLGRLYFPAMLLILWIVWIFLAVLAGAGLGVGPWIAGGGS